MTELVYTFIDRTGWDAGPWDSEPDKIQFEAHGLPCLIVRHESGGHLCGYVGVGPDHPFYQKDYDTPPVQVHGGLTYASLCVEDDKEHGICHVAQPGQPDPAWWFGFDCAHVWDMSPGTRASLAKYGIDTSPIDPYETYKTIEYVRAQTIDLALQLSEVTHA